MSFDAIVVGSGISGGWVAKELCERGLKVLVLERGPKITHGEDYNDQDGMRLGFYENQIPQEERDLHFPYYEGVAYGLFQSNKHLWASDHEYPYETEPGKPYRWIRGYQLGGRSLTWGRMALRWGPADFEANLKDGHGVDWPIRYEDLEEWYDYVEAFAGVSGDYHGLPQLPDGDFLPPFAFNAIEEIAKERIEAAFPTRNLIMGRTANLTRVTKAQMDLGRQRCEERDRCLHGCPLGAYFSSQAATLPAAEATGNLTIVTDAIVDSITYDDKTGRASGVRVIDRLTKEGRTYEGRLIFLNASTINSAAILLNSKSEAFPRGLANGSDQVGRNLMDHVSPSRPVIGRLPGHNDVPKPGERPTTLYVPRYAHVTEDDKPYLRGFGMQGSAYRRRWPMRQPGVPVPAERPRSWVISLLPFGEVLPNPENRVTLSTTSKDKWGIPLLHISCAHGPNEERMIKEAVCDAYEMLEAAGCDEITPWEDVSAELTPPGDRIHEMGTARMGRDPKTSVLNGWCQAHEVPNLFVTDGSVMTSAAAQNPSLTYMALSARAAHHAADLLQEGAL